jgi:DDE superfamily endonuclease
MVLIPARKQRERFDKRRAWYQRICRASELRQRLLCKYLAGEHFTKYSVKQPMYGMSKARGGIIYGGGRVQKILEQDHEGRVFNNFRMHKPTFLELRDFLLKHTLLRGSRGVDIEEKLGIFLYIVSKGASHSDASEFFDRSKGTTSACFDQVLRAMVILHAHEVQLPDPDNPAGFHHIQQSQKFFPFFKDCLGAIDGTHIYSYQSVEKAIPFRNRKGEKTQNVLAACTFDLQFSCVFPGWEGSAHDTRVLQDALDKNAFSIPPGKFYLADAGYTCRWPFLVPYRGVRYHLREQNLANLRPKDKEGLFNLRHSSLRNAIERIFGVLKGRFKIFNTYFPYNFNKQKHIVFACTALHNFIRRYEADDIFELEERRAEWARGRNEGNRGSEGTSDPPNTAVDEGAKAMEKFRDGIATAMWSQYSDELARRMGVQ